MKTQLKMKKQKGFTVVEVLIVAWVLFVLSILGGLIVAMFHFIAKAW